MPEPSVHVLVINWNGREHLDDCFTSLLTSEYRQARFVLIDNASTDGSADHVVETYGHDRRVEVVRLSANLGWSGGNNEGLRRALDAGADYVLLLNNDTRVRPNCIEELVAQAESDPSIGALAPKLLMFDHPGIVNSAGLVASTIGAAWDRGIGEPDRPDSHERVEVVGVCGAGFFIRCAALRKTGLLPEDFGIYLDDLDLSLRIWNAGYRIVTCPGAQILHKFSATMGEGRRARHKYYLNTRNRARILLRNFPRNRLPIAILDYKIGEARAVGRALLNGEWWKLVAHLRAWIDVPLYIPAALRERAARKRAGIHDCRFWHLIIRSPQFFPGMPAPNSVR